jgi:hypothetical protein
MISYPVQNEVFKFDLHFSISCVIILWFVCCVLNNGHKSNLINIKLNVVWIDVNENCCYNIDVMNV